MKTLVIVMGLAMLASASYPMGRMQRTNFMKSVINSQANTKGNAAECNICKMLYTFVANIANEEEPVIQKKVDALCADLGPLASVCTSMVNSYLPTMIKGLQSDKDENEVCSVLIKACPSSVAMRVPQVLKPQGDFECTVCDVLYEVIAGMAQQDEPQILAACDDVCKKLGPLDSVCESLVNQYVPQMIKAIQGGADQTKVCVDMLGLCSSKKVEVKPVVAAKIKPIVTDDISCTICEVLYSVIAGMAGSSEPEIQKECDSACDKLGFLASTCKDLVNEYLPKMVSAIQSGSTESEVCGSLLGLCDSKAVVPVNKEVLKLTVTPVGDGVGCTICDVLFQVIASMAEKYNQTDIINACDSACQDLGPLDSICEGFVKQYVPEMIKAVEDGSGQSEVCATLLGLCSSKKAVVMPKPAPAALPIQNSNFITCEVCKLIVDLLTTAVKDHDQSILGDLEKVCDIVPGSFKSECTTLIQKYGTELLNDIINGAGDKACSLVGLC